MRKTAGWFLPADKMALLENDKIRLRALEPEDLDWLYRAENDTRVWQAGATLTPFSRYVLREYIEVSHRDIFELKQLRLVVEIRSTAETAGMIDLFDFDPHHRRAGVGVLVGSAYRRGGVATDALGLLADYAFSFLGMHQLYAHVPVDNQASKALFSKCGFTVTGLFADWLAVAGGYQDVWMMQLVNK